MCECVVRSGFDLPSQDTVSVERRRRGERVGWGGGGGIVLNEKEGLEE
jgi:hypothetical protein